MQLSIALTSFYNVDEAINTHSRERVADASSQLCKFIGDYVDLVREHRKKCGEDAFLDYPTCISGHYFLIGDRTRELQFNPTRDYEGLEEEKQSIDKLVIDFQIRKNKIPQVKFCVIDSGEGFFDSSLRGRLELNRELLKRVGLELPEI